jgi:hypothetical protein
MKQHVKRFCALHNNIQKACLVADNSNDIFLNIVSGFKDFLRHADVYLEVKDIFIEQIIYMRDDRRRYRSCSLCIMCEPNSQKTLTMSAKHLSCILKSENISHEKVEWVAPNKLRIVLFEIASLK